MWSYPRLLTLISAIVLAGSAAQSATITGTVKGVDGSPFMGAFVEAQNAKTHITVEVLSDGQGHYRIESLPAGEYRVQIRAVGFSADPRAGVSLTADQNTSFDFALKKANVRWSDISFYQGMKLFPPAKGKDLLIRDCSICHEFQTRMAAAPRDEEGWRDRVEYMRTALKVNVSDQDANDIASYIASLFGPDAVLPKYASDMPAYKDTVRTFSSDAMNIVYVEYDMPGPGRMPFSAAPDKDGNFWIPNFGSANKITRLDAKTGQMQDFTVPNIGAARVHSVVPAPDGTVWLTEQQSDKLGKWDPVTQKITEYQDSSKGGKDVEGGGPDRGSKHTVRIARDGKVWASGSPLTMFDPETEKFTHFDQVGDAYDVKPDKNGDVWFTSPGKNKIGKVNGNTLKVTMWPSPTPDSFPRRLEIAPDGMIWFDEFNTGKMARFDPQTQTFKEFTLPGPDPTPYGMGFDADGSLWYDSHRQDTFGRVDVQTGKVTEYPFPHSELCAREFFRDSQGRMWYGSNPNNRVGYFYLTGKNGTLSTSASSSAETFRWQ
jgi:virginiamycin B lyase